MTALQLHATPLPTVEAIRRRAGVLRGFLGLSHPIYRVGPWIWEGRCPECSGLACRFDMTHGSLRCPACEVRKAAATVNTRPAQESDGERLLRQLDELATSLRQPVPFDEIQLAGTSAASTPELAPGLVGRGEVVMLVADAKVGKSNLAADLCARLIDGCDFLGITPGACPLGIGWLDWDTSPADVRATLARFGITDDDAGVCVFGGYTGPKVDAPGGVDALVKLASARGLGLLVIDSLAAAISGDENSTRDMSIVAEGLKLVARDTGCTVLVLHHMTKGGDYRGASALKAGLHRMLELTPEKGGSLKLKVTQRHGKPVAPIQFRRVEQDNGTVRHVLAADTRSAQTKTPRDYRAEILAHLRGHGPDSKDGIRKAIGGSKVEVPKVVDAMLESDELVMVGRYRVGIPGLRDVGDDA